MVKRLLLSSVAALAIAVSFPTPLAAKNPHTLLCRLTDGTEFHIVLGKGGWKAAERHCLEFWHGVSLGVVR